MSKVTLTQDEKDCLKPLIEHVNTARTAFITASKMVESSERAMWKKIREIFPGAVNLEHPEGDGENWTVTLCDTKTVTIRSSDSTASTGDNW